MRSPSCLLLLALAHVLLLLPSASSLLLSSPSGALVVAVEDLFPRALNYTFVPTNETITGALVGWGFHLSLSLNDGMVTCGESGLSTAYAASPAGSSSSAFFVSALCVLNWPPDAAGGSPSPPSFFSSSSSAPAPPPLVSLSLNGSVSAVDVPAGSGGGARFSWELSAAGASLLADGSALALSRLEVTGMELLTWLAAPLGGGGSPRCFYVPDDDGVAPPCGVGDSFFVDAWSNVGLDEWFAPTWAQLGPSAGAVDINSPAGASSSCMLGATSRGGGGGAALSLVAGGWTRSGRTGAVALSSQRHLPFWTGPRSYDAPGRCGAFTVAPSVLHVAFVCGSALPVTLGVGLFGSSVGGGSVGGEDVLSWRRLQFPRADALYRTTLPYKLQLDVTAYTSAHDWNVISFAQAAAYMANLSAITDGYPQTPILVGWQGLGHDTLYPALDAVNERLGGSAGLAALSAFALSPALGAGSSLSYHINGDEAYSLFNGSANAEFDARICRLNVDHATPWLSNCSVTGEQTPNCGVRCSVSKSRDAASLGRYERIGRMLGAVPAPPPRTVHSDAWRDVGASWEPLPGGYLSMESEQFCGQVGDAAFWASHGASLGCEGQNGQPAEMMGIISYQYHADGWDPALFGRIVAGSSLGFDSDMYCDNAGGLCSWDAIADAFYLDAKIYQLALTDELLARRKGTGPDGDASEDGGDASSFAHAFRGGGRIQSRHTAEGRRSRLRRSWMARGGAAAGLSASPPSSWPFGGDSIPVAQGDDAVLAPLVQLDGSLSPNTLHAYQASGSAQPPDSPSCPLFSKSASDFLAANNTALGDWSSEPYGQFEMDPSIPELEAVGLCNATCWANASCAAWDMIKVTPFSGKTKPLCMLFDDPVGCVADPNQWAGVKQTLPVPPPPGALNQTWTLPLSWVGKALSATTISPDGPQAGVPQLVVQGRALTIVGIVPGYPVRITAAL